jgi:flagellar biosynthetic protein FliR
VAQAFDPLSMQGNSVFGRFYNLLATALLLATDGHALILRGFTTSFRAVPLDGLLSMSALMRVIPNATAVMFLAAVQIAGPLIAVLFCTDVALGLLTRVSPALNIFSLAFPVKILLTLALAGITIALLPRAFDTLVENTVRAMLQAIGAG